MLIKKGIQYQGPLGALAAGLLAVGLYLLPAFTAVENQLHDEALRRSFKWAAPDPPKDIVIVAIDDASLGQIGVWPWPRRHHAEVLERLKAAGAKVIGVDIGFIEPDRDLPENDRALAEATALCGNVVYPIIIEPSGRKGPIEAVRENARALGHVHVVNGEDGVVRTVKLSYDLSTEAVPAWGWSLEILRAYLDLPEGSIRRTRPGEVTIGNIRIPVAEESNAPGNDKTQNYALQIGFVGAAKTFKTVPAHRVLAGELDPTDVQGKIVLYGGTAAGLFDFFVTPFSVEGAQVPGVEVQASIIHTILAGQHHQKAGKAVVIVLTLLAALAVGFVYQAFEMRVAAAALVLFVAASLGAYFYLFGSHGYWIELSPIWSAIFLSFILSLMLNMRRVNVALDVEILNLSRAAALGEQTGEDRIFEVFKSAQPTFREVLGIEAAALLRMDRKKGVLRLVAHYGLAMASTKPHAVKLGALLRGLLIGFEPIPLDGSKNHPLTGLLGARARTCLGLAIPLVAQGDTVGVLAVFRSRTSPFRPEEQDLLQAAASELGTIWYNAALYARLVRMSSNPLAPFTYKSHERRTQTLAVLTDSVLSEKALIAAIMDSIEDGVIVTDVMGTIRLFNPKAREILGLYAEDTIGLNAADFIRRFHDVPYADIKQKFQEVVEHGKTFNLEIALSLPSTRYYTLTLGAVRSKDGLVKGLLGVLSDITEFKEMDQMKTDLMSMVTHEIRTPLATVRGFAQILLKGSVPEEKAREFLEIINRQSNRLVNLVNDFLDITRIESGRQTITKGPVEMDKLVGGVLTDLKPLADERGITLHYDKPASALPEIFADRNLMEQVVINLVSNAIKYSPRGAWTRVGLRQEFGRIRVDVKDNGLGIPREALPRLFEKFYRVRADDRKDIIGTGLGLSLVKQIIQVHDGSITVESEHGAGSTFTFTLPMVGPAGVAVKKEPVEMAAAGARGAR